MDNLTHTLTGFFLSRAGLNRLSPDGTWILVVAANAPDLDVVSWAGGSAFFLHWHRNFTHSLAFAPLLAIASVLFVRAFTRVRVKWGAAFAIALMGVFSHILLDLTNNYGVRPFLPFSAQWFHWDFTYVLDFWIWGIYALCLFAPMLSRLVSSEMESRRMRFPGRGWPVFALLFLATYDCGRMMLHRRAINVLDARTYAGEEPLREWAFASPASPFSWNGVVETQNRMVLFDDLGVNDDFNPDLGTSFFKTSPGDFLPTLRKLPGFGTLIEFDQVPLWRKIEEESSPRYLLTDLRFGDPVAQSFTCSTRMRNAGEAFDSRCDFTFSSGFERR